MLDKMREIDCAELSKCTLQYSFGKFLVKIKDYEKANQILKEALERLEENNVSVLTICNALVLIFHWFYKFGELCKKICKEYCDSLYNLCMNLKSVDEDLAIQLADNSKDIALKSISYWFIKPISS